MVLRPVAHNICLKYPPLCAIEGQKRYLRQIDDCKHCNYACLCVRGNGRTNMAGDNQGRLPAQFLHDKCHATDPVGESNQRRLALLGSLTLLVLLVRSRTMLDLWLLVTLLAWLPNF